ncbi:cytosolic carboxypeptidase [Pycnococcus provasolii]
MPVSGGGATSTSHHKDKLPPAHSSLLLDLTSICLSESSSYPVTHTSAVSSSSSSSENDNLASSPASQCVWRLTPDGLTIRADFDSANLAHAALEDAPPAAPPNATNTQQTTTTIPPPSNPTHVIKLTTKPDCANTPYQTTHRSWFHFAIDGAKKNTTLHFVVTNLNKQARLFAGDFRPVTRSVPSQKTWERVKTPAQYTPIEGGGGGTLAFKVRPEVSGERIYVAFCVPWSYEENCAMLDALERRVAAEPATSKIFFRRQLLVKSTEGRRVELLTVTDASGYEKQPTPADDHDHDHDHDHGASPPRFTQSDGTTRPYFFLSARVHPGETPASHMLNGALAFLLRRDDPRALALRRRYVFLLVPILNPDGVVRGHYRNDVYGRNLNRCYNQDYGDDAGADDDEDKDEQLQQRVESKENTAPVPAAEGNSGVSPPSPSSSLPPPPPPPEIVATRALLLKLASENLLGFYVDLHAHANKRGCFAYGNALPTAEERARQLAYCKLVSLNCAHFDVAACNFAEKNMCAKDKVGGASKEGSGRVSLYRDTGCARIFTVEASYAYPPRSLSDVPAATGEGSARASPPPRRTDAAVPQLGVADFMAMGKALLIGALDLAGANPWSRLPNSPHHRSFAALEKWSSAITRATGGAASATKVVNVPLSRSSSSSSSSSKSAPFDRTKMFIV